MNAEMTLRSALRYVGTHYGGTEAHHLLTKALERVIDSERTSSLAQAGVCTFMQRVRSLL